MLNKNTMNLVDTCTFCDSLKLFNGGNGQTIREVLIRSAVKYCDMYATDMLILLTGSLIKKMFEQTNYEIDIYFRSGGVEWLDDDSFEIPKYYRRCMKLVKEGHKLFLYDKYGNC